MCIQSQTGEGEGRSRVYEKHVPVNVKEKVDSLPIIFLHCYHIRQNALFR